MRADAEPGDGGTERHRDLPLADVLELQRLACANAGSSLYARLLEGMADDVRAGGICHEILEPWADNALADAIPLRFLATVHHLVLSGRAPGLAPYFPSAGGDDAGDPLPAFFETAAAHREVIEARMDLGVQTNEVGRAAALVGGFHLVSRRSGLPLRVLEVGASAGLLLRWDRFGYRGEGPAGTTSWGDLERLVFDGSWTGRAPTFDPDLRIAERRGCDIAPIDPTTDEGVARLRSFLWPDQVERRHRLDTAIAIAREVPATVDAADAGEWIETQVAEPTNGLATVVYHSIVLQYLPRATFERLRAAMSAAGARATSDAPLHWLRMEPAGEVADVRLRSWTGGADDPREELLATAGYHGPPVTWRDAAADGRGTTR